MNAKARASILLSASFLVLLVALSSAPGAAKSPGDVAQRTSEVQVLWSGVTYEPAAVPADKSGWFVRSLETVGASAGRAGLVQTVVLLDGSGQELYRSSVVLNSQGKGAYSGIDVRVEDVTEVQVFINRRGPRRTGVLPRSGADLAVVALLGAALIAAGLALRYTLRFARRGRIERA